MCVKTELTRMFTVRTIFISSKRLRCPVCPSGRTNGVGLGHSGSWRLCLGLLVGEGGAEGGVWCETRGAGKRLVPAVRLEEGSG